MDGKNRSNRDQSIAFKLLGDVIALGFAGLKDALPRITKDKKGNPIILGKWQKKK